MVKMAIPSLAIGLPTPSKEGKVLKKPAGFEVQMVATGSLVDWKCGQQGTSLSWFAGSRHQAAMVLHSPGSGPRVRIVPDCRHLHGLQTENIEAI